MKSKIFLTIFYIIFIFNSNLFGDENNKKLKVGLLAPLSGPHSEIGNSLLNSLQLALEEINDTNVIIIPRDSGFNDNEKLNTAINDMDWNLQTQEVKISNMWAIINKKGSLNQKHLHSNNDLSAAYYVTAEENCGDIIFYDPRPATIYKHPIAKKPNILNATINSISPEPGMLVLFPSYLEHSVDPNLSEQKRIVISFNLSLDKK